MDERAFRLGGAREVGLGELEDELEEELEDELEELEKLKELEEEVVVEEGLWALLGLSQPNLLKPLTGRAWGAGAFADLGGLPLFLLGPLGTWVGGTGVIMLAAAVALEALLGSLGFFLLGGVELEKSTGVPLYMAGRGRVVSGPEPAGSTNAAWNCSRSGPGGRCLGWGGSAARGRDGRCFLL